MNRGGELLLPLGLSSIVVVDGSVIRGEGKVIGGLANGFLEGEPVLAWGRVGEGLADWRVTLIVVAIRGCQSLVFCGLNTEVVNLVSMVLRAEVIAA
jgi:hypothetical protein